MQKQKTITHYIFLFTVTLTIIYNVTIANAQDEHNFDDIPQLKIPNATNEEHINKRKNTYSTDSMLSLYAGAEASIYWNDNIFHAANNKKSSLVSVFAPNLRLRSDLLKHYFATDINFEIGKYFSYRQNNYIDFNFRVRGRLDISDNNAIHINSSHKRDHIAIGSFEDEPANQTIEETKYIYNNFDIKWIGNYNQIITYDVGALTTLYDYDNVKRVNNTINIHDDRDRKEYELYSKLGYNITPITNIYAGISYNTKNYDNRIDTSSAFTRNSDGYKPFIGITQQSDALPYGFDFQLGYLSQNYDAQELKDSQIIATTLQGHLNVNDKLSFIGSLTHNLKESNSTGVSSYVQTRTSIQGKYKFDDAWEARAQLRYTKNDFNTNLSLAPLDRVDDIFDGKLWVNYEISSRYILQSEYKYVDKQSNDDASEYINNTFGITFKIKH